MIRLYAVLLSFAITLVSGSATADDGYWNSFIQQHPAPLTVTETTGGIELSWPEFEGVMEVYKNGDLLDRYLESPQLDPTGTSSDQYVANLVSIRAHVHRRSLPAVSAAPPTTGTFSFRFEGFGGQAVTYDKPQVYAVTTLAASGPGSLLEAPANSYVIFLVSGDINITADELVMAQDDIWVLGQTSEHGIQIRGGADNSGLLRIRGDRQIWQHMRVRPDAPPGTNCCHKPIILLDVTGGVVDHMSFAFGDDDTGGTFQSSLITWTNNLHANGLTQTKSARASVYQRGTGVTIAGTLYANQSIRAPKVTDIDGADVYNTVAYNLDRGPDYDSQTGSAANANHVNNIHILGPQGNNAFWQNIRVGNDGGQIQLYATGNKVMATAASDCSSAPPPFYYQPDLDGAGNLQAAPSSWFTSTAHPHPPRPQFMDTCDVLAHVLSNAGATHNRDSFDAQVIADVLNNTGAPQSTAGPWPTMQGGTPGPCGASPWDATQPDYIADNTKALIGIPPGTNTLNSNLVGSDVPDFVAVMNYCFGV